MRINPEIEGGMLPGPRTMKAQYASYRVFNARVTKVVSAIFKIIDTHQNNIDPI